MRAQAKTFNTHTIWDTSYQAVVMNIGQMANAKPVFLEQSNADPNYAGMYTIDVRTVALQVMILNYATQETLQAQLAAWFRPGTRGNLVATFDVDDLDYQLPCVVVTGPVNEGSGRFTIILQSEATAWRAVTADTDTWEITGTSGSKAITVEGDDETRLSVSLTPSVTAPDGYAHQQLYQLVPANGLAYGVRPWCVTLNTAALISDNSNKCQINDGAGIAADTVTIPYDTVTGSIPSRGMGYVGTEQIAWTGKTGTTAGNLTGCTRGLNGTTAAVHADNAVIYVSKMQVDGHDLRIWLDDKETRRWISGMNTTTTHIWFNVRIRRGVQLAIRTAVADAGDITYLDFKKTPTSLRRLRLLPEHGILVHGTEWIYYSGKDLSRYRVTVEARGMYDTTLQAHAVGDNFDLIPAAVRVVYGKQTATDPSLDDEEYDYTKPLFSLSSSDNTQWVWTASDKFYDPDYPDRTGGWKKGKSALGDVSEPYWIKADAESGDAAMGMTIGSWLKGTTWQAERAWITWLLSDPTGIMKVTVTGRKYRTDANWPASRAAIQRSPNGVKWYNVFNEATPGSADTWTALTNDSTLFTIASTTKKIRAIFGRTFGALADAYAKFEILTCTAEFTTANIPAGALQAEATNYALELTLANSTTGDSIDLELPMRLNRALVLNGESMTAKYMGANAHNAIALDDDGRSVWIRLAKGSNTLTVSGVDFGTLTLALSWYRRRL